MLSRVDAPVGTFHNLPPSHNLRECPAPRCAEEAGFRGETRISDRTLTFLTASRPAAVAASVQEARSGRGCRLLLVEDDAAIAGCIRDMLTFMDYEVLITASAVEALTHIEAGQRVDIVLSDLTLGSGASGAELVRTAQKRWNLPVVLMTGYPSALDEYAALGAPILLKPFGRKELFAALDVARAADA